MSLTFLHTADWQIGKPFQSIAESQKREHLRLQRIDTVASLKDLVASHDAAIVVVAGDIFDSFTPDKATVSALCKAVGGLKVPVIAIPGNHDYGGPGCVWTQQFFIKERDALAPNFHILLEAAPFVIDEAVILPCPLLHRHTTSDPTAWLHTELTDLPSDRPWIALAHGSTQGFSSSSEDDNQNAANLMDITRIPEGNYDYIALGDWHGTKQITGKAWYSGTPEQDRYSKGENNDPGNTLVVSIDKRKSAPSVQVHSTGKMGWHQINTSLADDSELDALQHSFDESFDSSFTNNLLKLDISGTLSLTGSATLDGLIESLGARLIDLRLTRDINVEPSDDELAALTDRDDPLISGVASSLHATASDPNQPDAGLAKLALRELHIQLQAVSK